MWCSNKWLFFFFPRLSQLYHHRRSFSITGRMVRFYGSHLNSNYFPAAFLRNHKTKVHARTTATVEKKHKKKSYCHGAQHGIFWKMLFALNTVSVLTLIDVPVCFPLLLQTEKHTQEWLLSAWRSETKTAPFCCFFSFFFLRTISYFAFFPPFSFPVQRAQRQKNGGEKTDGENDNEKRGMRESEREREYMVGDSRGMRGLSQRQIPKINSITLIGNTLAKRVHDA